MPATFMRGFMVGSDIADPGRYERKFVIRGADYRDLEQRILTHPAGFRPLHHERQVNNVYLDDSYLTSFHSNVAGEARRRKVRVRWYGALLNRRCDPTLEIKLRRNQVGSKLRFPLQGFDVSSGVRQSFVKTVQEQLAAPEIVDLLGHLEPVLVNQYVRRYYATPDGKLRLTLDWQLKFFDARRPLRHTTTAELERGWNVIELKYPTSLDRRAKSIAQYFPVRMTRMSKYVSGVYMLFCS